MRPTFARSEDDAPGTEKLFSKIERAKLSPLWEWVVVVFNSFFPLAHFNLLERVAHLESRLLKSFSGDGPWVQIYCAFRIYANEPLRIWIGKAWRCEMNALSGKWKWREEYIRTHIEERKKHQQSSLTHTTQGEEGAKAIKCEAAFNLVRRDEAAQLTHSSHSLLNPFKSFLHLAISNAKDRGVERAK